MCFAYDYYGGDAGDETDGPREHPEPAGTSVPTSKPPLTEAEKDRLWELIKSACKGGT